MEHAGVDATESFDNVGHSAEAKSKLATLVIGEVKNWKKGSVCACSLQNIETKPAVSATTTTSTSGTQPKVVQQGNGIGIYTQLLFDTSRCVWICPVGCYCLWYCLLFQSCRTIRETLYFILQIPNFFSLFIDTSNVSS